MKTLAVHYQGWGEHWLLGTLADDGRHLVFEYSPEAIRQGLELSPRHLKLGPRPYGEFPAHQMRLPGLVADALPDGWGLLLMDRLFRQNGLNVAALSPLDRLAFIGDRAMGALSFEPAAPVELTAHDIQLLDVAQEARAVIAGQDTLALRELALMGGSPHGARPKLLVHYQPATGSMSTAPLPDGQAWLVKFQAQQEHKEVCAVEHVYAQLAQACGLDMPATRYFDLDKSLAAFGIARFDVDQGRRVPVHTLAGALHADFRLPSAIDYTTFLRATRFFTQDEREVLKAYERAVFNVVFNNRDDHGKNLSFRLGADRRWRLAPCYDLTYNEGPGGEHQMDVCGEGRHITRAHLLRLAEQGGVPRPQAAYTIDRLASQASQFKSLAATAPIRKQTVQRIWATINANCLALI